MRRIKNEPPKDDKTWQKWLADCEAETKKLDNRPSEFKDLYKRSTIKNSHFGENGPFFGKCAYCESPLTSQPGEIGHFRPKAKVRDEDDKLIQSVDESGKSIEHPGYYGLAYEWTNLLLSCSSCNNTKGRGSEKIGKGNRFPVKGKHAFTPAELVNEEPLLINPASGRDQDDPTKHFKIDYDTGVISSSTDHGNMCIKIFGLNKREQLLKERKKMINYTYGLLINYFHNNKDCLEKLEELNQIIEGKCPYTLASDAAFQEFQRKYEKLPSVK